MGSVLYDFLSDSFLLRNHEIESEFEGYSDAEIRAELLRYRNFCIEAMPTIASEIEQTPTSIRVFSETEHVSLSRLKQTSLYIEQYVLADPLLSLTLEKSENQKVMGEAVGFIAEEVLNRKHLTEVVGFLKAITPMVAANYIKFFPVSYFFEPPESLPLNFSENYFSDVLPERLLSWFRSKSETLSMRKTENGWAIENKLYPCRAIHIGFSALESSWEHSSIYFFHEMEPDPSTLDRETGRFRGKLTLPDTPPDTPWFDAWVFQSENQSAKKVFDKVLFQASLASKYEALYLTEDEFIFELLQQEFGATQSLKSHTASTVMKLALPFLERVDIADLMQIRLDDGEAFKSFRLALEKQFRELRLVRDEVELKVKTENALHELMEVQVYEVEKRIKAIKKQSFAEAGLGLAGLLGAVQTGGFSVFATAAAVAGGYKSYQEYQSKVKENPAFFMWKVLENANRRKGLRHGPGRRF